MPIEPNKNIALASRTPTPLKVMGIICKIEIIGIKSRKIIIEIFALTLLAMKNHVIIMNKFTINDMEKLKRSNLFSFL